MYGTISQYRAQPHSRKCVTAPKGSCLAVLGQVVAETRLLRSLAGLQKITSQVKSLFRRNRSNRTISDPTRTKSVGMVFQDWALFPHLTVRKHRMDYREQIERNQRQIHELLEMVGIPELADRLPLHYQADSNSELLYKSSCPRPSVLLLDEPFSSV